MEKPRIYDLKNNGEFLDYLDEQNERMNNERADLEAMLEEELIEEIREEEEEYGD